MSLTLEALREEIFALDEASQTQLAEELDEHLAENGLKDEWVKIVLERRAAHLRGEGSTVTMDEVRASVKQQIENFRRREQ